jgi:hypothetical protein
MAQMAFVMNIDKCIGLPHLLGHVQTALDQPPRVEYV